MKKQTRQVCLMHGIRGIWDTDILNKREHTVFKKCCLPEEFPWPGSPFFVSSMPISSESRVGGVIVLIDGCRNEMVEYTYDA